MPRRRIIAIILMLLGAATAISVILFGIAHGLIIWSALIISILYFMSGFLLYKGKLIGHYITTVTLSLSLAMQIYSLFSLFTSNTNIEHKFIFIVQYFSGRIALILFFGISLFLIINDIIKTRSKPDYNLKVNKYNEPELWLYPWFISLICLYLVRYDLEISYILYLASPVALLIIHKMLKRNSRVSFEGVQRKYIISLVIWFIPYVSVTVFSGYMLAQIGKALSAQGAGH